MGEVLEPEPVGEEGCGRRLREYWAPEGGVRGRRGERRGGGMWRRLIGR